MNRGRPGQSLGGVDPDSMAVVQAKVFQTRAYTEIRARALQLRASPDPLRGALRNALTEALREALREAPTGSPYGKP